MNTQQIDRLNELEEVHYNSSVELPENEYQDRLKSGKSLVLICVASATK